MTTLARFTRRAAGATALLAAALLSGCATSHPALLMDQSQAQQIECHGVFGSWSGCRAEAMSACESEFYQVLSRNHQEGASEREIDAANATQAFQERSMLVRCQPKGQQQVAFNG